MPAICGLDWEVPSTETAEISGYARLVWLNDDADGRPVVAERYADTASSWCEGLGNCHVNPPPEPDHATGWEDPPPPEKSMPPTLVT